MEPQLVDALGWIRSGPQRFFPSGKVEAVYLLAYIMADVLELGRGSLTVRHEGEWWIVGSEIDWLETSACSPRELFQRVVAEPGHGEHSMRGEVLVGAFATTIWISLDTQREGVKGDSPPDAVWQRTIDLHRAIVFRLAGGSEVAPP
jgi:hypothetical protein